MKIAHVFDYDDTLATSDYYIHVYPFHDGKPTEIHRIPGLAGIQYDEVEHTTLGSKYSFSTREFVKVSRAIESNSIKIADADTNLFYTDGHSVLLDFGDVIYVDKDATEPIQKNMLKLEKAAGDGCDIWIVTGRSPGGETGIQRFIKAHTSVDVPLSNIICVGGKGPTHTSKSQAFLTKILPSGPYEEIHFYDDDDRNLETVKSDVSPFARLYVVNSVTDKMMSDAKDRIARAQKRRKDDSDFRRIRQLTTGKTY